MAKKRSKKDKQRSQLKRQQQKKIFGVKKINQQTAEHKIVSNQVQSLFAYPVKLIYQDLLKTLLVTIIIIMLLVALAIYL